MSRVDQVGGDHYQAEYQHWDWAAETALGYLEGNATKYVSRWRKKNGVEDLKKALSYVNKLIGVHNYRFQVPAGFRPLRSEALLVKFCHSSAVLASDVQIIRRLDTWQTFDHLLRAAAMIQDRMDNPDINHPAPFGWPGQDSGCE